jgi:hypothetical protein
MSRHRFAARAGVMIATVVTVVLGVAIHPVSAAPAPALPPAAVPLGEGTTVTRTVFTTAAGEEYVAQQSFSVAAASAPAAATQACPAPPPDSAASGDVVTPQCEPPIRCRTLDSLYHIYVIPTYAELARWRIRYTWCWQGSLVTSAVAAETTPDILSGTIRVSGAISRTRGSLPGYGGVNVYTEGLQFEVVVLGVSVKAFNPKIRFWLTSTGNANNLSILA